MRNIRIAGATPASLTLSHLIGSAQEVISVTNLPPVAASLTPAIAQIGPDNGSAFIMDIVIAPVNAVMMGLRAANRQSAFIITPTGPTYFTYSGIVAFTYGSAISLASSRALAQIAISQVQNALNYVADVRAFIGQQERRIDHIIDDIAAQSINVAAAKSRIMDAEMGAEIAEFTRLQILQQSGTAVLAQANMSPAGILELLR